MQITLTTTGRRSGERRTVTLYAFEDGDRLVVVGSWGGKHRDPAWALNLRATPTALVTVGRDVRQLHAAEVDGPDRERLWELVCAHFPLYRTYQARTRRRIPLFVLEPARSAR